MIMTSLIWIIWLYRLPIRNGIAYAKNSRKISNRRVFYSVFVIFESHAFNWTDIAMINSCKLN